MKKINNLRIREAYKRIKKYINFTPFKTNKLINKQYQSNIYFKIESKQKTGSFKIRGATNKILQLNNREKKRGIVAYSSGNHGQAVSYICKILGISSIIVMPRDAPTIKINKTKKNGAKIVFYNRKKESREKIAKKISNKTKRILIRPFDDEDIIIGQGTIGYEIYKSLKEKNIKPDVLLCCCSGGGLIAGIATYIKSYYKDILIYSVEPKNYNDMKISLEKGKLTSVKTNRYTICDALTVKIPGKKTFKINKRLLNGGIIVNDNQVKQAIRFLKKYYNIVSEGGGAASTAAFLSNQKIFKNKNIIIIVSGSNIDPKKFKNIINEK